MEENTSGYSYSDDDGEHWYYYGDNILSDASASIRIHFSDGRTEDYHYDTDQWGWFDEAGNALDYSINYWESDGENQYSNPWKVGEEHEMGLSINGIRKTISVNIAERELTEEEKLELTKEKAKTDLADAYNLEDYREAEQEQIQSLLNEAYEAIDAAEDIDAVNTALEDAQTKLAAVKTASQLDEEEAQVNTALKVSSIKLSGISHNIAIGKKISLKATVLPNTAANKVLKWKVNNKKWATVDSKGTVKLSKKAAGKTIVVTATAADGSGKTAKWKIKGMKGAVKKIIIKGKKAVKAGKSIFLDVKSQNLC